MGPSATRNLIVILGDQLQRGSAALADIDPLCDRVWMAEVNEESTHVWSHKARIALFLVAMRHFRDQLTGDGLRVDYHELAAKDHRSTLTTTLRQSIRRWKPRKLILVQPGEYRVQSELKRLAGELNLALEVRPDNHFLCTTEEFDRHADGRKQLRMEYFYREMRRRHEVLLDGDQPVGGQWNYDPENRASFGRSGPAAIPAPRRFKPDKLTREVLQLVASHFASHPGSLEHFDWPVTTEQAEVALQDFIDHRLGEFGTYQDAMWIDQPYLYHSRLSSALNLKLLNPRRVIAAAEQAYRDGTAPLNAVEGFIRQILGWREYVRGVYWRFMPDYLEGNALAAERRLPGFYWTADTDMNCLKQTLSQTLEYGYAHHIQRLMVTGLYALLLGVDPREVHRWYLAVYVDAVEWVELPNTLGMSQYADGGIMASKPYVATGKYIQRMSNYCVDCPYDPAKSTGEDACPFTTLYWDFLMRHHDNLQGNRRMSLQVRNVSRKKPAERSAIQRQAEQHFREVEA